MRRALAALVAVAVMWLPVRAQEPALVSLAPAADIWTVVFMETQSGTLVRDAWGRDIPSHGRAWIDSPTGRILRTERITVDTFVRAEIDVCYRTEPALDVLIPGDMRESYVVVQQAGNIDLRPRHLQPLPPVHRDDH